MKITLEQLKKLVKDVIKESTSKRNINEASGDIYDYSGYNKSIYGDMDDEPEFGMNPKKPYNIYNPKIRGSFNLHAIASRIKKLYENINYENVLNVDNLILVLKKTLFHMGHREGNRFFNAINNPKGISLLSSYIAYSIFKHYYPEDMSNKDRNMFRNDSEALEEIAYSINFIAAFQKAIGIVDIRNRPVNESKKKKVVKEQEEKSEFQRFCEWLGYEEEDVRLAITITRMSDPDGAYSHLQDMNKEEAAEAVSAIYFDYGSLKEALKAFREDDEYFRE